ncbi:unnamed protein product [Musa acuminata subsp. malaccensis]|uniref:(wild Malaysian banana) hypothetical protein n=1 Tax=Musa acuminata subsp. malaccensis TaxID=214687 RepID=A0A804IQ28_MUSAM|nr:unnamed protein product [Musa acuminata subsp. malaccensis]
MICQPRSIATSGLLPRHLPMHCEPTICYISLYRLDF